MTALALTEKERFLNTLLEKEADRFPYFDLEPMEGALERWRREGFPADCSVAEFFKLEIHHPAGLMLCSFRYFQGRPTWSAIRPLLNGTMMQTIPVVLNRISKGNAALRR